MIRNSQTPPPKRRASDINGVTNEQGSPKLNKSCFNCRKAHKRCSGGRPCARCTAKGCEQTCYYPKRKRSHSAGIKRQRRNTAPPNFLQFPQTTPTNTILVPAIAQSNNQSFSSSSPESDGGSSGYGGGNTTSNSPFNFVGTPLVDTPKEGQATQLFGHWSKNDSKTAKKDKERRRKVSIKIGQLKDKIPCSTESEKSKWTQLQVLTHAVQHIKHLQEKQQHLRQLNNTLRKVADGMM